jgi:hypothetical protein
MRCLPLQRDGAMAQLLSKCLAGARSLAVALSRSRGYALLLEPPLDIVTYFPRAPTARAISAATDAIFRRAESAAEPVYLAKLTVNADRFRALHPEVTIDAPSVTILRSCLMRPEQADWVDTIVGRLERLA